MKEISLNVKGMMCSGCENRVMNALKAIKGVESALADHVSGKVTVTAKDKISDSQIADAVEALGYEVER